MFQVRLQAILIFTEEEVEEGAEGGDCSPPSAGSSMAVPEEKGRKGIYIISSD